MNRDVALRITGNVLLIIGYFIMLWTNFKLGLMIKFLGGLLGIPFAIRCKFWDIVMIGVFYGCIEAAKLSQIYYQ